MGRLATVRYLFDECVPSPVVEAMHGNGVPGLTHVKHVGLLGASDETLAAACSKDGKVLVTRDHNQLVNLTEIAALSQGRVKAVFVPGSIGKLSGWKTLQWFCRHWDAIHAQAKTMRPGEILLIDLRGKGRLCDDVHVAVRIEAKRAKLRQRRMP